PFPTISAAHLMEWQDTGSTSKLAAEVVRLARDILQCDDFVNEDVAQFSNAKESKLLDEHLDASHKRNGWIKLSVTIPLPCEGRKHPSEGEAPTFAVDGLYHRRLLDVVMQVFESSTATTLHMTPFQQYWLPDEEGGPTERIHSDMYNSDAMLEAHEAVQKLPLEPDEANVERVVVAVTSRSDATYLANFGAASLWPGYTMLGNQSKYTLLKPTSGSCHHTMYVPKVRYLFRARPLRPLTRIL
ncbi:hypothetical protein OF83DRAFT_1061560, partial [Amylostereum chailletii]